MKFIALVFLSLLTLPAFAQVSATKTPSVQHMTAWQLRQRVRELEKDNSDLRAEIANTHDMLHAIAADYNDAKKADADAFAENDKARVDSYNVLVGKYNSLLDYSQQIGIALAFASARPIMVNVQPTPVITPTVSRPVNCTSNAIGTDVYTNCY